MNFSRRVEWNTPVNGLTLALRERRERGLPIFDLTESNPTNVGLDYPFDEIGLIFQRAAAVPYAPEPAGLLSARESLAEALTSDGGKAVSPDDLILTASTSEAYSFLFKMLADPGDEVLTAVPGYPLFDHLASLEGIGLRSFPLQFEGRWSLRAAAAEESMTERTRAVAIVHPNNPTGSFLRQSEQDELAELCRAREAALISDEVFFDYEFTRDARRAGPAANREDVLSFSLGGLSKSAGLPHLKLGWIRAGGPLEDRARAVAALELIADSFLSVATPVQHALPELLAIAPAIRSQIRERLSKNLAQLANALSPMPHVQLLTPEGGWSAVIRVPRIRSDEETALALLEESGVLVHPGFFFDFASEGFLVLSLLPPEETFSEGARGLAEFLKLPRTIGV